MPDDILARPLDVLEAFRSTMTRPSFRNFLVLATGWILTPGRRAVTAALVATGVAGRRHHAASHRFFSRASWEADSLGFALFLRLERVLGDGAVRIAIDDTLAPHKGPRVFGSARTWIQFVRRAWSASSASAIAAWTTSPPGLR